jgi:hypothetical protein
LRASERWQKINPEPVGSRSGPGSPQPLYVVPAGLSAERQAMRVANGAASDSGYVLSSEIVRVAFSR